MSPGGITGGEPIQKMELRVIDLEFADFLCRLARSDDLVLKVVGALLSYNRRFGIPCLDLRNISERSIELIGPIQDRVELPSLDKLCESLSAYNVVGHPGEYKPLILDKTGRLYMYRFWRDEQRVAERIVKLVAAPPADIEDGQVEFILERYFRGADLDTDQRMAAKVAIRRGLCVITGGPGTGKTYTLTRVIAAIIDSRLPAKTRIALAAPTGKAAARMAEMVNKAEITLSDGTPLARHLTEPPSTIHRLLGSDLYLTQFRYSESNPLPYDVVAIDEASMVDLFLMARLLESLKPGAKLILCGDRNQLASVEPGSVFADICSALAECNESCLVQLRRNYRFSGDSLIHRFGSAVIRGDSSVAAEILEDTRSKAGDLVWLPFEDPSRIQVEVERLVVNGFTPFWSALHSPEEAIEKSWRFRILCAVREGPFGLTNMNRFVEMLYHREFKVNRLGLSSAWFPGQIIMITVNDYSLRLFNGDCGVVLPGAAASSPSWNSQFPVVCFPSEGGQYRFLSPSRLPSCEPAFAITIHKSQGSEFDEVLIVLPPEPIPLLTRELVYTAVTRARNRVYLLGTLEAIREAANRSIVRESGLKEAILEGFTKIRNSPLGERTELHQ